jgi:hypothetical protein
MRTALANSILSTDDLNSKHSSRIITILVGPKKVALQAREEVLIKIPYFQECLTGQFVEATLKENLHPELLLSKSWNTHTEEPSLSRYQLQWEVNSAV